ncbi:hypothetical protein ACFL2V_05515 [Pseudomonadota bacterium]
MKKRYLLALLASLGTACTSMDSKMDTSDSMMKEDSSMGAMNSMDSGAMMKDEQSMDTMKGDGMMGK